MPFEFEPLSLPGLVLVRTVDFRDARGSFRETYKASAFRDHGLRTDFRQDNLATSRQGVIRGLHFQRAPSRQAKLVRCVAGSIRDVAADLRDGSSTYGRWQAVTLEARTGDALYIPEGFAHGYLSLEDGTAVAYKVTGEYDPSAEDGVRWDDPQLAIDWTTDDPILSGKDLGLPLLRDLEPL